MVKARAPLPSSSSERPCPPLASLSLASSAHLCKPSRPLPFFSLLNRAPFLHTKDSPAMDYTSNSRCSSPAPSSDLNHSESSKEQFDPECEASLGRNRHHRSKLGGRVEPLIPFAVDDDDNDPGTDRDDQVFTCGRQRLQQHRSQMSGKVIIPDTWGSEQQLQEWVSYGIVEDALRPAGLMSARAALVKECQRRGNNSVQTSTAIAADVEVS